jgi:hypothetical protein
MHAEPVTHRHREDQPAEALHPTAHGRSRAIRTEGCGAGGRERGSFPCQHLFSAQFEDDFVLVTGCCRRLMARIEHGCGLNRAVPEHPAGDFVRARVFVEDELSRGVSKEMRIPG